MAEIKRPQSYIEAIQQGGIPDLPTSPTIIVGKKTEEGSPSLLGGLAALGATVIGASTLGRLPGVRNFFKTTVPKVKITQPYTPVKATMATENLPTATGQAQELINTSRALTIPKSKYNKVADIPFTQGKGYTAHELDNPLVGHASYDRVLEAPFEKAPAKDWIKWLSEADSGQLKVPSGTLAGVSRQVQKEELADLNLLIQQGKEIKGGFLKSAMDEGLDIDRELILKMIKSSPLNNIKPVVKVAPGNLSEDVSSIINDLRPIQNKLSAELKVPAGTLPEVKKSLGEIEDAYSVIKSQLSDMTRKGLTSGSPIGSSDIKSVQDALLAIGRADPELAPVAQNALVKFNKVTGVYNNQASPIAQEGFYTNLDKLVGLPKHKQAMNGKYDILGVENFTEKVFIYDNKIPKVRQDRFKYVGQSPHFVPNKELFFVRYDDLPNPKLGGRHIRVSEAQSDLHQPATSAMQSIREDYFINKVNTFNSSGTLDIYKKQLDELREQIRPYMELGRGSIGLTKQEAQNFNRLKYKINQLEKSALTAIVDKGSIQSTTYGPLGNSFNDYMIKDLLRTMAKRNINHISIVPAPMNGNIKGFDPEKFGNEMNYGLMNGKKMTAEVKKVKEAYMPDTTGMTREQIRGVRKIPAEYEKTGRMIPSNQYSVLNESLNRIAKQYGAKFELQPMPKSNPNKPFKVIQVFRYKEDSSYRKAIESGRAHYTKKRGKEYIYEDHMAAADTPEQAETIAKAFESSSNTRGKIMIKELSPDSPQNYEMVPTLSASSEVLKKFLLPFKAYMHEGGFVDKTNIFKSII